MRILIHWHHWDAWKGKSEFKICSYCRTGVKMNEIRPSKERNWSHPTTFAKISASKQTESREQKALGFTPHYFNIFPNFIQHCTAYFATTSDVNILIWSALCPPSRFCCIDLNSKCTIHADVELLATWSISTRTDSSLLILYQFLIESITVLYENWATGISTYPCDERYSSHTIKIEVKKLHVLFFESNDLMI